MSRSGGSRPLAHEAILLVGEAPSATSDPRRPLEGRTGAKLAALAGMSMEAFGRRFALANLLHAYPGPGASGKGSAFPDEEARVAASQLRALLSVEPAPRRIVLLGKRVARAFGERAEPLCAWRPARFGGRDVELAVVPHPSGVNKWYNSPENVALVERFLFEALVEEA